jgi:hypothetical protein
VNIATNPAEVESPETAPTEVAEQLDPPRPVRSGTRVTKYELQRAYEDSIRRHLEGRSNPETEYNFVPGEYEGISGTFANACRLADYRQRKQQRERHQPADKPTPRAAASTVEALMYSLRERRTAALEESDTQRRLAQLSEEQLVEVADRLQRLKPHVAQPWSEPEIASLLIVRNLCSAKMKSGAKAD